MTEQSTEERLAALRARRAGSQAATTVPQDDAPSPPPDAPAERSARRSSRPTTMRVATAGTSIVSFAAMVAAMGPLTADAQASEAPSTSEIDDATLSPPPTTPEVIVEVIPNYITIDPTTTTPQELDDRVPPALGLSDGSPPADLAVTPSPGPAAVPAAPVPGAPAPAPAAPTPTAAPAATPAPTAPAPAPTPAPTAPPAPPPATTPPPPPPPPVTVPPPPPTSQASG